MEAIKKLNEARKKVKGYDLKKSGFNDYSKYDYYTPEQINKLVNDACNELNLFNHYTLVRSEFGLIAKLRVIDIDSGKYIDFEIASEIPEIKATNAAQQLGGAVTYTERYLLMIAYDIKDNNLDFDAHKKPEQKQAKKEEDNRPWLSDRQFTAAKTRFETANYGDGMESAEEFFKKLTTEFRMKKTYRQELEKFVK